MCMIVDANSAHHLRDRENDVWRWLSRGKRAGLVVGGKLTRDLDKAGLTKTLVELNRAGRLHRVSDADVEQRETALVQAGTCVSNDTHVVALAMVSRCELVFTADAKLHTDLQTHSRTGQKIKIYQRPSHRRLLKPCTCMAP